MGGLTTVKGGTRILPSSPPPSGQSPAYLTAARENGERRHASDEGRSLSPSNAGLGILDPTALLNPLHPLNPVGVFSQSYSGSADNGSSSCSSSYDSSGGSSSDCGSSSSSGGE